MQIRRQEVHGQDSAYPSASLSWFHNTSQEPEFPFLCFVFFKFTKVQKSVVLHRGILSFSLNIFILVVYNSLFNTLNNFLAKLESRRPECICRDVEPGACQVK